MITLSQLLDTQLHFADSDTVAPGDAIGKIDDVLIDFQARHVLYLHVQTGDGWEDAPLLIGLNRLNWVDRQPYTTLDKTAIEIAYAEAATPRPVPLDPARLPAVVTGPFGNSVSPQMAAAALNERLMPQGPSRATPKTNNPAWRLFTSVRGLSVFGDVGELGTLSDITFEPETGALDKLVVEGDGSAQVSADLLAHFPKDGTHIVTRAATEVLRQTG